MTPAQAPALQDGWYYCQLRYRGLQYDEWCERKGGQWELEREEEFVSVLHKMEGEYVDANSKPDVAA